MPYAGRKKRLQVFLLLIRGRLLGDCIRFGKSPLTFLWSTSVSFDTDSLIPTVSKQHMFYFVIE